MNEIVLSPRVWLTVAAETSRYWLRRQRAMMLVLGLATLVAGLAPFSAPSQESAVVLAVAALYAPLLAGLLAMSGIVADERASGLIVMWFQKPGTLFRSYLIRYLLYLALIAALTLGLAMIVGVAAISSHVFTFFKAVRVGAAALPMALIPAATVFACSAWGARRDSTVAFSIVAVSVALQGVLAFDPGVLARVIKVIAFPIDPIMAIAGGSAYDSDLTRPLAVVAAHLAAWTALGLLGLRYTERALQHGA